MRSRRRRSRRPPRAQPRRRRRRCRARRAVRTSRRLRATRRRRARRATAFFGGRGGDGGGWTRVVACSGGVASFAASAAATGAAAVWTARGRSARCDTCHQTSAPSDEGRREPDVAGSRPEVRLGEREERAEGEQADADEQPGLVAASAQSLDGDRLVVVLAGDHEPRGEIEQQPGSAHQRECGERDPVDERVDVEVVGRARRRRPRASGLRSGGRAAWAARRRSWSGRSCRTC